LYLTKKGEDLSVHANSCFDGEGCYISADDILRVEFLE
jgi:hypothetical protein